MHLISSHLLTLSHSLIRFRLLREAETLEGLAVTLAEHRRLMEAKVGG
jgi:hypothetical protein